MQEQNPTVFTKRASYDGRKNLYSPIQYSFGDNAQVHARVFVDYSETHF